MTRRDDQLEDREILFELRRELDSFPKGVMPNAPFGASNTSASTGASPSGERD